LRAVLQRVIQASVTIEGQVVGEIGAGFVALVAAGQGDTPEAARVLADKIAGLRVFADSAGKFNLSAKDVGAEVLVVSQFTLYADTRKGRRPSFVQAAPPEVAEPLVDLVAQSLQGFGLKVQTGRFGAHMLVSLQNDGPVTIVLDTQSSS
jgi:D-aminoacyl-tRNA deacylase